MANLAPSSCSAQLRYQKWDRSSFCEGWKARSSSLSPVRRRLRCCMQTGVESTEQNQDKTATEQKQGAGLSSSLSSLDSYFNKLKGSSPSSSSSVTKQAGKAVSRLADQGVPTQSFQDLSALNAYFGKMQPPPPAKVKEAIEAPKDNPADEKVLSFLKELEDTIEKKIQQREGQRNPTDLLKAGPRNATTFTNAIIGLNVAVFLFGLASPIQTPEMVEVPLPLLYGAKINTLIGDGQWWRLITPMFLHDGLIHIGLGAWALLSFGPAVEYVYGSAGFCMIYFLGGIFGNLLSFFHTPAPTVGGTGPLYALVAAWAVYVFQNRNTFGKEMQAGITSDVIQKILVMIALHLALTDALPADNWTHVGATLVGTLFALFATPKAAQVNVGVEDLDNKMVMFGEAPDLQRLTVAFALCVAVYFCLYSFGTPATNELLEVLSQTSSSSSSSSDSNFI